MNYAGYQYDYYNTEKSGDHEIEANLVRNDRNRYEDEYRD
jgi:hypothetical protein